MFSMTLLSLELSSLISSDWEQQNAFPISLIFFAHFSITVSDAIKYIEILLANSFDISYETMIKEIKRMYNYVYITVSMCE